VAKRASSRKTAAGKGKSAAKKRSAGTDGKSVKKVAKKAVSKSAVPDNPGTEDATPKKARPRRIKSPLTAAQLRKFRQMLLEKRRELVGDMTGIEAEALGADRQEVKGDISDHPADAGTDNFEQEFSLGLLESERILLGEIDEALRRIEEGHYGICIGTGEPISKARLNARPWAKYGIEYARMVERGLVRPGDIFAEEIE
jgi:RNA polymerase-binding protein DksA